MSFTLSAGDTSLAIDTLKDLSSLVSQNGGRETLFKLAGVASGVDEPISQFKQLDTDLSLTYCSDPQTWSLDGGIFSFGISGGASGTVHVYSPGKPLFTYTKTLPALNGFDAPDDTTAPFSGPAANYYVGISLQLKLDVNAGGAGDIGFVGIKGSADACGTYNFSFFKSVAPATTLGDALIAAFRSFTLPLHEKTFSNLTTGDSILHNFKADLNLAMGLSYGIATPSVAQNISAGLTVPGFTQGLPSVSASVDPSAGINVSATAKFEYSGAFEAYLYKESDTLAHYHLYRSKVLDASFGIDASASLLSNTSVSVDGGNIASAVSSRIGGRTGDVIGQIVSKVPKVQSSIDAAASDINAQLTNILTPVQGGKAELQLSIEKTDTRSILLDLSIDLTKPGFELAAWNHLSAGDFVSALEQDHSGVTVDAGSGLEQLHHRKTDLKFTFFNFTEEWSTTKINDYSITYGGNNSFAFTNMQGIDKASITNITKTGKDIQFYFTISAMVDNGGNVTVLPPDLHVTLKSMNNPTFGTQLPKFLSLLSGGPAANLAATQMNAIAGNQNAVIEVDLIFKPNAYERIVSSPCPLPTANDAAEDRTNYATFANAVLNSNGGVANVPDFSYYGRLNLDYDFWALAKNSQDDQYPPRDLALPNRKSGWIGLLSQVRQAVHGKFPNVDDGTIQTMLFALNAAASFMNLCQDIRAIGTPPVAGAPDPLAAAQEAFAVLNTQVGYILKNDVYSDYLIPTAASLGQAALAQGGQIVFSPPVLPTATDPGYKLTMVLS